MVISSNYASKESGAVQTRIADEIAIRRVTAQFTDAVNQQDFELFRSLWVPDGVWEIKPPTSILCRGVNEIVTVFQQLLSNWKFFMQVVNSGTIEIDGDRAKAHWYMQEIGRPVKGQDGHMNYGLYIDEFARSGHIWLFVQRTYHYIYIDNSPITGRVFPMRMLAN